MEKKKKIDLLTDFGLEVAEAPVSGNSSSDPALLEPPVEMKVYLPKSLRDALDRIALRDYGRGKMRNQVVRTALERYVEHEQQEEEEA